MKKKSSCKKIKSTAIVVIFLLLAISSLTTVANAQQNNEAPQTKYRVGFLGVPDEPEVEWNDANMQRMKDLGFNTLQLNIAWGSRPNDEALNLEDVVAVPRQFQLPMDRSLSKTLRTPERIEARSEKLRQRIAISKKYGFHIIFHFGAPSAGHPRQETEPLPQCIMDTNTVNRYVALIRAFNDKFPGVDDLLLYTYDQDAWLCSEYGPCPRCHGVPLAKRASAFVNTLARTWRKMNPGGRIWWEPWELSAGQVYKTMELLDASCIGMSIHSGITEVQIAYPADRWFKNVLTLAARKNIPVIGEVWTGSPTEELEPYTGIPTPLLTLRELRAINTAGTLTGIKEYYGNVPGDEDPNLRMTGIFFHNPEISDSAALGELSAPYMNASEGVRKYWTLSSEAIAMYPWDITWFAREVGRSNPVHSMTEATLRGATWETPSWQSSRKAAFIRTDNTTEPNFWEREDAQIRFDLAAVKMEEAIGVATSIRKAIPQQYLSIFDKGVEELSDFRKRCLAFAYHLRETNLATLIRTSIKNGLPVEQRNENIAELREMLLKDQANQNRDEPIAGGLKLLDKDVKKFLDTYFLPAKTTIKSEWNNNWSITSE